MTISRPPFFPVLDSTILSSFRACPQLAYRTYLQHYKPRNPSVHLHAGGAFAHGLEVARVAYYRDGVPEQEAVGLGIAALLKFYGDFECPKDSAKSADRMAMALAYAFDAYPMSSDPARPITLPNGRLGVEFSFAEPIDETHPETGDPLLYVGRLDMLVEYAGAIYGEDDKTTSSLGASWSKQWDMRCFSPDTELLTAYGWKRIDRLTEGESIAQWASGEIEFVPASDLHSAEYAGNLVEIAGAKINQLVTPNHRIPLELRRGGSLVVLAENLTKQDQHHKIPLSGKSHSEKLPPAVQRYIVALQADGSLRYSKGEVDSGQGHREHMPHPAASFKFTKERKMKRLREILKELDTPYTETTEGSIYVSGFTRLQELASTILDEDKHFQPTYADVFDETFLLELEFWDGWQNQYYTVIKQNAEFVQTVAHLNNWRASIKLKINHTQSYVVCLSKEQTVGLISTRISEVPYVGKVWCLSVPSGFVLTKRAGVVSVSGNSQFTAYTWGARQAGIPMAGFLVRGIAILKTKFDTQQAITYRPQWMIDRWYEQTLADVKRMKQCWESGMWDYNLDHSCEDYGGCPLKQVCLSKNPQPWLDTQFERRVWDPVKREEIVL